MGDTGFGRVYYGVCVVVVSIGILEYGYRADGRFRGMQG